MRKDYKDIQREELRKLATYFKPKTGGFVYHCTRTHPGDVEKEVRMIKLSGRNFRTKPIIRNSKVVAYDIYVQN